MKDKIKGGVADKKKPEDFDSEQLKEGIKHEMEHTKDKSIAREIAMDHLTEDPNYYDKIKAIEKYDRVDREPDGKQELDYGSEELDKRWRKLKKALNHEKAIMSISQEEEPEQQDAAAKEEQGNEEQVPPETEGVPADGDTGEEPPQDGGEEAPNQMDQQEEEADPTEALIEALKADGHSDQEIDYIIHGHVVPQATKDDHDAKYADLSGQQDLQNEQMNADMEREHKKRMSDLEYEEKKSQIADPSIENEHRKRMLDLEYDDAKRKTYGTISDAEHKQRMLDLEYEQKKKEMELELEHKKRELEQKMRLKEEQAAAKKKEQTADKPKAGDKK